MSTDVTVPVASSASVDAGGSAVDLRNAFCSTVKLPTESTEDNKQTNKRLLDFGSLS